MKLSKTIELTKNEDEYKYTINLVPTGNENPDSYNLWITQYIIFEEGMESIQSKIKIMQPKEKVLKKYEEITKVNVTELFKEWDKNENIKKSRKI